LVKAKKAHLKRDAVDTWECFYSFHSSYTPSYSTCKFRWQSPYDYWVPIVWHKGLFSQV